MEFGDVGTIPYDPPPRHMDDYIDRKFKTMFRAMLEKGEVEIERVKMVAKAKQAANADMFSSVPEREATLTRFLMFCDAYLLFGKQRIGEGEFVALYKGMVFADCSARKEMMKNMKKYVMESFHNVETNRDGFIDFREFCDYHQVFCSTNDVTRDVFRAIDLNNDGLISKEEWIYSVLSYFWSTTENDSFSSWYGPIVDC